MEHLKRDHLARGFNDIGYHFYITQSGTLKAGRALDKMGAHVKGYNKDNIGICLEGGINETGKAVDNFSEIQMAQLRYLLTELQGKYGILDKNVKGHRDWPNVAKDCPCFDINEKRKEWV